MCHEHRMPFYRYACRHAQCNAHHLREVERAWEQDQQQWARRMMALQIGMATAVDEAVGGLPADEARRWRRRDRQLLKKAELECPAPDENQRTTVWVRLKRSKALNVLEQLRVFEQDVLCFMVVQNVYFTNNQGENDLRMIKAQQKMSGCFCSVEGEKIF